MGVDPLSAIAPARVKVLILPFGRIKQSRYLSFVARLQQESIVRLGDVSPDGRPHRTMFSPLAFPTGSVLYDLSTSSPSPSHLALAPFELYREPLILLAVSDGLDVDEETGLEPGQSFEGDESVQVSPIRHDALVGIFSRGLEKMQLGFPKALFHQILIFNCDTTKLRLPDGVLMVPSPQRSNFTTIKTLMCDMTSNLLAEMTTLAKSLQALPTLESPKQLRGSTLLNGYGPNLAARLGLNSTSSRPLSAGETSRSSSPSNKLTSTTHHMSIPTQRSSAPHSRSETPSSRNSSVPAATRAPPTTFDDIAGNSVLAQSSYPSNENLRRPVSQDRVSMHGFGVGSIGERERNKGKGRVGVVIGSLYLLAGRWPDAIRELVESATIAKNNSDHLWHAKALDHILVCLLMCAWAGMDFQIPQILFPGVEKSGSSSSKTSSHTPSNNASDLNSAGSSGAPGRLISLQKLTDLLPDLVNNILNLYARAWTFTDDKIPQLAFSETTIRFTKLLSVINLSSGILDDDGLGRVLHNPNRPRVRNPPLRLTSFPTKAELTITLFRAFPGPSMSSIVPIEDRTMILAAIASVLSELGYHRKKSLVLRELLSALIPALVEARKNGAAEMGFHPAASLATINATIRATTGHDVDTQHDSKNSLQSFLALLCHVYGIPLFGFPSNPDQAEMNCDDHEDGKGLLKKSEHDATDSILNRIAQQEALKFFGYQHLKLDVLRSCIDICEALPDLEGVLRFSAEMLRIGGSGIAPGPDSSDGSPTLSIEDQVHLAANISRTVNVAQQLGKHNLEAEYWDEFLVRVIDHVESNTAKTTTLHAKADLEAVKAIGADEKKNPFIYNPFMKPLSSNSPRAHLVAQEEALFRVTLQNLYDVDVEIERIRLESSGLPFESSSQSTVIRPYGAQTIFLAGVPRKSGTLIITGCSVKVKGCRERRFPIFNKAWAPKADILIGPPVLDLKIVTEAHPLVDVSASSRGKKSPDLPRPTASLITLNVIHAQPNVVMKSISVSQSAIMLLEGEMKAFRVALHNVSPVAVDILFVSFNDSSTLQPRPTSTDKELSAIETYEQDYASLNKQSFRWRRAIGDTNVKIGPEMETTLEIEVLGKPGLSFGTIQVDYGHLGDTSKDTDHFYTRRIIIPLTITVNASIEMTRNDLIPFASEFAWQNRNRQQSVSPNTETLLQSRLHPSISQNRFQSLLTRIGLNPVEESHCLLLIDLRNSWPSPLTVSIQVRSLPTKDQSPTEHWKRAYTVHETLQPGHTSRILLLLPRIYISNPHAIIPSLAPANKKRQFILSTAPKPAPEAELAMREAFHYREALLNHIRARWEEEPTRRTGNINLRALHLTTRMVSALRLDDLDVVLSVHTIPSSSTYSTTKVLQVSPTKYIVPTSTFLTLRTTLTNRSPDPIHPLLRLQPALKDQPHNIALDLSKKLLWSGLLQRALEVLEPGQTKTTDMGVLVLCRGVFEVGAIVEEVVVLRKGAEDLEGGVGGAERRVWGAREPCVLIARDSEEGEHSARDPGDGKSSNL